MKKVFLCLPMLLLAATFAFATEIKINASLKNGDKIAGKVQLRVTVESDVPVNQVEFYHAGRLLLTDTSTPYVLDINTVIEEEGTYEVEVAVYLTNGENKRQTIRLVIDNNVGAGAAAHTENAVRFLQVGNYDGAIQAGLVALKADDNYAPAKIAVARGFYGKEDLAEAQTFAESALIDGENRDAYEILSAVFAKRSFRLLATGTDKMKAMQEITQSLKSAVQNKRKAVQMDLRSAGSVTDENVFRIASLHIQNNEFGAVSRLMRPRYNEFDPDTRVANMLLYSLLRQGKIVEAAAVVEQMRKHGAPDEATFALMATAYAYYRNFSRADESLRNATLAGADDNPLVMTSAAFVAIKKNDRRAVQSQVQAMVEKSVARAEVYFYLSVLQLYLNDVMAARDNFERTVVADPLLYDAYIHEGFVSLGKARVSDDKELLNAQAAGYMEVALEAAPDSPEALNGLAIVYLMQNKNAEALRMAEAAVRAGSEHAFTWYTYSCALDRARQTVEAANAAKRAGEIDTDNLKGRAIATVDEAWNYTVTHGRIATLVPPQ
jgi:pentatricopeptide repeat protein